MQAQSSDFILKKGLVCSFAEILQNEGLSGLYRVMFNV